MEGGDVIETHHFATLIGFGANAVNALAGDTIRSLFIEELESGEVTTNHY